MTLLIWTSNQPEITNSKQKLHFVCSLNSRKDKKLILMNKYKKETSPLVM